MSYSLNFLKGLYGGLYRGTTIGHIKGDARSSDYRSYILTYAHRAVAWILLLVLFCDFGMVHGISEANRNMMRYVHQRR